MKLPIRESYKLKENVYGRDDTKFYIEMIEQFINDPDTLQDELKVDGGLADRIYEYGEKVMRIWSWRIKNRTNDCSIN